MKLRCRDTYLSLDRTVLMGVLNVTPDSFSDGGMWLDAERAVGHGLDMAARGASIIDVEVSRPGRGQSRLPSMKSSVVSFPSSRA